MHLKYNIFLMMIWAFETCICQTEVNNTVSSRREILEQQARQAYQNTCLRLQELSNWMTVLFKIKSVWASSTVNQIAARSEGVLSESNRRHFTDLPSRPKASGSECSLKSVQVTAQTYAFLQSQLILLKRITGRNILKSSKEKLDGANVVLKERMKMLDVFNSTLNDILSKLKQNTREVSAQVNSENWKAWNIMQDIQEGRFLQYLQGPKILIRSILEDQNMDNYSIQSRTGSRNFFQNFGRILDRIIFPTNQSSLELNITSHNASLSDSIIFSEEDVISI